MSVVLNIWFWRLMNLIFLFCFIISILGWIARIMMIIVLFSIIIGICWWIVQSLISIIWTITILIILLLLDAVFFFITEDTTLIFIISNNILTIIFHFNHVIIVFFFCFFVLIIVFPVIFIFISRPSIISPFNTINAIWCICSILISRLIWWQLIKMMIACLASINITLIASIEWFLKITIFVWDLTLAAVT